MDADAFSHQVTEPSRVQVGAAANDTMLGQAAQFPSYIGQNINWFKQKTQNRVEILSKEGGATNQMKAVATPS